MPTHHLPALLHLSVGTQTTTKPSHVTVAPTEPTGDYMTKFSSSSIHPSLLPSQTMDGSGGKHEKKPTMNEGFNHNNSEDWDRCLHFWT